MRIRLVLMVPILLTCTHLTAQCVDCRYNEEILAGHGAASSTDNRRKITVSLGDVTGLSSADIQTAMACARDQWNNATDQFGNKTGFFFVTDQSHVISNPSDITISSGTVDGGAALLNTNQSSPWTMTLDPNYNTSPQYSAAELCGRIAHELGHAIGLGNGDGSCSTIMNTSTTTGHRTDNTVAAGDVAKSNQFLNNQVANCHQAINSSVDTVPHGS